MSQWQSDSARDIIFHFLPSLQRKVKWIRKVQVENGNQWKSRWKMEISLTRTWILGVSPFPAPSACHTTLALGTGWLPGCKHDLFTPHQANVWTLPVPWAAEPPSQRAGSHQWRSMQCRGRGRRGLVLESTEEGKGGAGARGQPRSLPPDSSAGSPSHSQSWKQKNRNKWRRIRTPVPT